MNAHHGDSRSSGSPDVRQGAGQSRRADASRDWRFRYGTLLAPRASNQLRNLSTVITPVTRFDTTRTIDRTVIVIQPGINGGIA